MSETKRFSFTKRGVEALAPPREKRVIFHDVQTRGLGVMIQTTGHRSFFWFRKVRGRPVWQTLGNFPDLSVEDARAAASDFNARLARWKASGYEGPGPFERVREMTLGELIADYIEKQVRPHAAHPERAVRDIERMLKTYLAPWTSRRPGTIRRSDVLNLHAELGRDRGKHTANRVVQLLRAVFNWADAAEVWHGDNPARRVKLFHEEPRSRFLQPDEMARLFAALRRERNGDLRDFVLLALFTGARKGDILSMRWQDIFLPDNRWAIPSPKNRQPYQVALTPECVELLEDRRKRMHDGVYVFPSRGRTGHSTDFKKPWQRLLVRAKIADLHVHDLRRTLGSWQAAQGASLQIIGKSLGHVSTQATEVYAHLNLDPVRASVMSATRAMLGASKKALPPRRTS